MIGKKAKGRPILVKWNDPLRGHFDIISKAFRQDDDRQV